MPSVRPFSAIRGYSCRRFCRYRQRNGCETDERHEHDQAQAVEHAGVLRPGGISIGRSGWRRAGLARTGSLPAGAAAVRRARVRRPAVSAGRRRASAAARSDFCRTWRRSGRGSGFTSSSQNGSASASGDPVDRLPPTARAVGLGAPLGGRGSGGSSSQMISASAAPGSSPPERRPRPARIGQLDRALVRPGRRATDCPWDARRSLLAQRARAAGFAARRNPFAASRASQRLVAFGPFAANPVARNARHVEILDLASGSDASSLKNFLPGRGTSRITSMATVQSGERLRNWNDSIAVADRGRS